MRRRHPTGLQHSPRVPYALLKALREDLRRAVHTCSFSFGMSAFGTAAPRCSHDSLQDDHVIVRKRTFRNCAANQDQKPTRKTRLSSRSATPLPGTGGMANAVRTASPCWGIVSLVDNLALRTEGRYKGVTCLCQPRPICLEPSMLTSTYISSSRCIVR